MRRGTLEFETNDTGDLLNSAANVERLRRLWLHRSLISGDDLGPGNRGDFDRGAWHVACHLLAAGGVRRGAEGKTLWLEISHQAARDDYYASVTVSRDNHAETIPIDSADGRELLNGSKLLGFVEGNSTGRISARGVLDSTDRFNLWRRQDFDQPVGDTSDIEGGRVWEHWCTTRDIQESARIGSSVLTAYLSLVAALGDRFAPTVARGRKIYGHPLQLAAMVHAGFTSSNAALWKITPSPLPIDCEPLLRSADSVLALAAAARLDWRGGPRYYMYRRRISGWNSVPLVRKALKKFTTSLDG